MTRVVYHTCPTLPVDSTDISAFDDEYKWVLEYEYNGCYGAETVLIPVEYCPYCGEKLQSKGE